MNKKLVGVIALVATCSVAMISYDTWYKFGGIYYGIAGFCALVASTICGMYARRDYLATGCSIFIVLASAILLWGNIISHGNKAVSYAKFENPQYQALERQYNALIQASEAQTKAGYPTRATKTLESADKVKREMNALPVQPKDGIVAVYAVLAKWTNNSLEDVQAFGALIVALILKIGAYLLGRVYGSMEQKPMGKGFRPWFKPSSQGGLNHHEDGINESEKSSIERLMKGAMSLKSKVGGRPSPIDDPQKKTEIIKWLQSAKPPTNREVRKAYGIGNSMVNQLRLEARKIG